MKLSYIKRRRSGKPRRTGREVDPGYLDWIRGQPCLICGDTNTAPHHVKSVGAGGGDRQTVPLCANHHGDVHQMGRLTFAKIHNIDLAAEAEKLRIKKLDI